MGYIQRKSMKSTWKKYLLYTTYTLLASGLLYGLLQLILSGYAVTWTGFQTKTLWDWMDLLIIPIVLALGAFLLNRSERTAEREIAKDRQRELLFQSYLDKMSEMLVENKLHTSNNKALVEVARSRTHSLLRELDGRRKASVVIFLRDTKLSIGEKPIISLGGADLRRADFAEGYLCDVNLEAADLRQARLQKALWTGAYLCGADLRDTDLRGSVLEVVNLEQASLEGANLTGVSLTNSNLVGTNLKDAKVTKEQLAKAFSLKGAIMPDGTVHA